MLKFWTLFFILILNFHYGVAQGYEIDLNKHWQFKQAGTMQWHGASVPGNVVLDLYQNQLIKNPYFADNENSLQWIALENWDYECQFEIDKNLMDYNNKEIVFEGLDTYAKVYLNDSLVIECNNMFRAWHLDLKNGLRIGKNTLRIAFASAKKMGQTLAKQLPYQLPEGERVFTRKAQFQYGWDFGPSYPTCGIWKSVKLCAWNNIKINNLQYQLKLLNDTVAEGFLIIETQSDVNRSFNYALQYTNRDDYGTSIKKVDKKYLVELGLNIDTIHFSIQRPRLWWCNGMGQANMYYLKLAIQDGKYTFAEKTLPIGIRKIELVRAADSLGESFYFKLNNKPVFIKGANIIPSDIFLSEKSSEEKFKKIKQIEDAKINMLRVWGGGVYVDDDFISACDKSGIMLWQDFAFACAMYPGDGDFLKNVKIELKEQITRLRNHPSLALWCGNNEIDEAWHNWGWQKQFAYSAADSAKIWQDYKKLFHEIIPQTLNAYDPNANYWPSSPSIGWGHQESLKAGDSHYWGVWWGMQEFNVYTKKVGRFMSEYGFQSMPSLATCKQFCAEADLNLQSKAMKAHQKHKIGFETIETYMQRDYKVPQNLSKYIYVSQLLQRDGMKTAIEAHRSNQPYCMGTMFWQLNDCWPGISWSALEYDGTPKALFYHLKSLYNSHLVSVSNNQQSIQLTIVSDSIHSFQAKFRICLKNYKSQILWETEQSLSLEANKLGQIKIDKSALPIYDSAAVYLQAELKSDLGTLAKTNHFFTSPKYLKLLPAKIKLQDLGNGLYSLQSDVFAKDVYVFNETQNCVFSDNFFDLEAGQTKYIQLEKGKGIKSTLQLRSMSLVDVQ
ncbi:MAG: glycoside hydrolase family 2 protein [Bacteroidota bacterium]